MESTRFSLCAFADEADSALSGQIRALVENKIGYIELRGIDKVSVADITPEKAAEVRSRLDDAGISVWSIGSPIGKVDISSPADDETDRFLRVIDTARVCGAGRIRLFSFYGTSEVPGAFDEVVKRLGVFCDRAAGSGVELCHENEKGIFGEKAPECAMIHSALPSLRAVFDPANFVQCGQDTLEAWELLGKYTSYCHIKDAAPDGHIVPPGWGVGNLAKLLPLFAAAGVEVLTLEPHLKKFTGLSALEGGRRPAVGEALSFASGREAFDFAAKTLRSLIASV
ncbi:MAG: sugar phosphate isomerase/epimerase [Clostridia bacterium]|nr:sugar phosphate isomerase/epimerase [Clostridia bacterium]